MSYVDGFLDREADKIHIVERVNGRREYREYPARYTFYYPDPRGKFTSIFGDKLEIDVLNGLRFSSQV